MKRKLYNWVLNWSEKPSAITALFIIAFAESSFFPVPPDVLLIALSAIKPKLSYRFALITTVGSVIGGLFGYLIGKVFFDTAGIKILDFYNAHNQFNKLSATFIKPNYKFF